MAGENSAVVDSSGGIAQRERLAVAETEQKIATQVLQGASLWQTARAEQGIPKPYDPSGQMGLPEKPAFSNPIKRFSPEGSMRGFDRGAEPAKEVKALESEGEAQSPYYKPFDSAVEEKRARLLQEFAQHLSNQEYYSKADLAGVGIATTGALYVGRSAPVGLALGVVGLGTSMYNSYYLNAAGKQALKTLDQMPKEDRERFQKYFVDMQAAKSMSSNGYIIGGGIALMSMTGVSPYIGSRAAAGAFFAAVGNDTVQTLYSMPKIKSAFDKDYEAWKQELKQRQELRK